jgi:hypothetical protein
VDVLQQLRAMRSWCVANPDKRKTRAGIGRFIVNWLAKGQREARAASTSAGSSSRLVSGAVL